MEKLLRWFAVKLATVVGVRWLVVKLSPTIGLRVVNEVAYANLEALLFSHVFKARTDNCCDTCGAPHKRGHNHAKTHWNQVAPAPGEFTARINAMETEFHALGSGIHHE